MDKKLIQEISNRNEHANQIHAKPDFDGFSFDDYINETVQLATDIDYTEGRISAVLIGAARDVTFGDFDSALKKTQMIDKEYGEDGLSVRNQLYYYSPLTVYHANFKGDFETAIKYAKLEMNAAEILGLQSEIMRIKMNIGALNIPLENFETAILFLDDVATYYDSIGDEMMLSYCYMNLGESCYQLKQYERAQDLLTKSLIWAEKEDEVIIRYNTMICLAKIEQYNANSDKALVLLKDALGLTQSIDNKEDSFKVILELLMIYNTTKDYDEAVVLISGVDFDTDLIENKNLVEEFYLLKAVIYESINLTGPAYQSLKSHIEIYKTIQHEKNHKAMNQLVEAEYKKNLERLNTIGQVGRQITMLTDIREIILKVKEELSKQMDIKVIGLAEHSGDVLQYSYYFCEDEQIAIEQTSAEYVSNLATWCTINRDMVSIPNWKSDYEKYVESPSTEMFSCHEEMMCMSSILYAPLIVQGELLGAFTIQSQSRNAYSSVTISIFEIIVDYVAIALKNAMQKQVLEDMSIRDGLTEMYNRRGFWQHFENRQIQEENTIETVSIVMLDLDYFKRVNDSYGHHVGDEVLRLIARRIMSSESDDILAGRLGGEEFGIMLFNKERDFIEQFTEKLRIDIERMEMNIADSTVMITTSIGACHIKNTAIIAHEYLYTQADKALYVAKEKGRNQIHIYDR